MDNNNELNRRDLLKGLGGISATAITGSLGLASFLIPNQAVA